MYPVICFPSQVDVACSYCALDAMLQALWASFEVWVRASVITFGEACGAAEVYGYVGKHRQEHDECVDGPHILHGGAGAGVPLLCWGRTLCGGVIAGS